MDNPNDTIGEGENSSGIPTEALAAEDSRDGSQTAAVKDDPKVNLCFLCLTIDLNM